MKAIIVDDSRAMRSLLRKLLREIGFDVVAEAENGQEGLAQLERCEWVDLVLLDWNMPVMDGFELLCEIRKREHWSDTRVMLVTTETEACQILRALDAGADEYLIKPFVKEALREKLNVMGLLDKVGDL